MSEKLVPGEGVHPELEAVANRTIKKVGEDIDALKANTAIAQLMIYVNALSDQGGATKAEYELLLQLLNPFAPHMTEELWQQLGHTEQLAYHAWPTYDEAKCVEQTIEIAVQVNGKVKARIKVPAAIENADAIAAAKAEPAVAEAIAGKTIAKEIYVKGKLVNIAVKGSNFMTLKAERRLCLFCVAEAIQSERLPLRGKLSRPRPLELMRGNLSTAVRKREAMAHLPLIRPCGATFPQRGRLRAPLHPLFTNRPNYAIIKQNKNFDESRSYHAHQSDRTLLQ